MRLDARTASTTVTIQPATSQTEMVRESTRPPAVHTSSCRAANAATRPQISQSCARSVCGVREDTFRNDKGSAPAAAGFRQNPPKLGDGGRTLAGIDQGEGGHDVRELRLAQ